uniref:Uncharacterized protein n=1 Tax=Lepeophtheirus salmonis TaxID=72036 RepID=A0A0K2TKP5_LEPSM
MKSLSFSPCECPTLILLLQLLLLIFLDLLLLGGIVIQFDIELRVQGIQFWRRMDFERFSNFQFIFALLLLDQTTRRRRLFHLKYLSFIL